MCGRIMFLVLFFFIINSSSSIHLKWPKDEVCIILGKKIQNFNNIKKKCNFIKNLLTLCWECNIIANEATTIFFTNLFSQSITKVDWSGLKWIEVDWNGPNGMNRLKWSKWTKAEWNGPSGLKWTKLDWNGANRPNWTEIDQSRLKWIELIEVNENAVLMWHNRSVVTINIILQLLGITSRCAFFEDKVYTVVLAGTI